ncbi:unnamed protein product [Ilex paraguariensis]|uniref:Uncharacterized protein n=1 Tax=Ilex paraguariensis TaxID=185542 RepID=A0ABC8U0W7_9AQUA
MAYEKERVRADNEKEERMKESVLRVSLEDEISVLKSEVLLLQQKNSVADNVDGETLLRLRVSELETELDKLKELQEKERIRADSEKKKADAEKKKANEARKNVKAEKARADEERRLADIERKRAEETRLQLESLKKEADEARSQLVLESIKFKEASKKLEAEKVNTIKERKRADLEMVQTEEQRKLAEMNGKKAMDEKCRADLLSQQMEQDGHMIEKLKEEISEFVSSRKLAGLPADLHREIQELVSSRSLVEPLVVAPDKNTSTEAAGKMKLLKKQLKFEKRQVKHAEKIAKLEMGRNIILQQELYRLKQEFVQFSKRLVVLDACFSCSDEGIDDMDKVSFPLIKALM